MPWSDESPERNLVLFVCVENTFRSVLSEAIFNTHAPEGWTAESAGVRPVTSVNPIVIDLLDEIGIRIGSKTPRLVTPEMIGRAQRVVTFGCLDRCPTETKEKSEDWPVPAASGRTFRELRAVRDELCKRVNGLIGELRGT